MERFINIKATDEDDVDLYDIEPSQELNEHSHLFASQAEVIPYSDLLNDEVLLNSVADESASEIPSSQIPPEKVENGSGKVENETGKVEEVEESAEKEDEVASDLLRLLQVNT